MGTLETVLGEDSIANVPLGWNLINMDLVGHRINQ
jgi:hypothetical protein